MNKPILLPSVCATYATVHGKEAAYLMRLIRGWKTELPGWMFAGMRREAVHEARMAARYALMAQAGERDIYRALDAAESMAAFPLDADDFHGND